MKTIGVDLSSYQQDLQNARILASAGVSFAIIKLTEGRTYKNASAAQHYAMLKSAGIKVGAYALTHAELPITAEQEAEAALEYLSGRQLDLPIFFDIEPNMWALGKETLMPCAKAFCRRIKAAGYKAGVYASLYAWQTCLDADQLRAEGFSIWCAAYNDSGPGMRCDIWQCSESWTIPGYNGKLDKDVLYTEDEDDDDEKTESGILVEDEDFSERLFPAEMSVFCRGFYGGQVKAYQIMLNVAGYPIEVTGEFDAGTEAATLRLQKDAKLIEDGIAGPNTMDALYNIITKGEEE